MDRRRIAYIALGCSAGAVALLVLGVAVYVAGRPRARASVSSPVATQQVTIAPVSQPSATQAQSSTSNATNARPIVNVPPPVDVRKLVNDLRDAVDQVELGYVEPAQEHPVCSRLSMMGSMGGKTTQDRDAKRKGGELVDTGMEAQSFECAPPIEAAQGGITIRRIGDKARGSCVLGLYGASKETHGRLATLHALGLPHVPAAICSSLRAGRGRTPVLALGAPAKDVPGDAWDGDAEKALRGLARLLAGLRRAGLDGCVSAGRLRFERDDPVLLDLSACERVPIADIQTKKPADPSNGSALNAPDMPATGQPESSATGDGNSSATDSEDSSDSDQSIMSAADTTKEHQPSLYRDYSAVRDWLVGKLGIKSPYVAAWDGVLDALTGLEESAALPQEQEAEPALDMGDAGVSSDVSDLCAYGPDKRPVVRRAGVKDGLRVVRVGASDASVQGASVAVAIAAEGRGVHSAGLSGVAQQLCPAGSDFDVVALPGGAVAFEETAPQDALPLAHALIDLARAVHAAGYGACLVDDAVSALSGGKAILVDGAACVLGLRAADVHRDWRWVLSAVLSLPHLGASELGALRGQIGAARTSEAAAEARMPPQRLAIGLDGDGTGYAPFVSLATGVERHGWSPRIVRTESGLRTPHACRVVLSGLRVEMDTGDRPSRALVLPDAWRGPADLPPYGASPHFVPMGAHVLGSGPIAAAVRVLQDVPGQRRLVVDTRPAGLERKLQKGVKKAGAKGAKKGTKTAARKSTKKATPRNGGVHDQWRLEKKVDAFEDARRQAEVHGNEDLPHVARLLCDASVPFADGSRAAVLVTEYFDGRPLDESAIAEMLPEDAVAVLGSVAELAGALQGAKTHGCFANGEALRTDGRAVRLVDASSCALRLPSGAESDAARLLRLVEAAADAQEDPLAFLHDLLDALYGLATAPPEVTIAVRQMVVERINALPEAEMKVELEHAKERKALRAAFERPERVDSRDAVADAVPKRQAPLALSQPVDARARADLAALRLRHAAAAGDAVRAGNERPRRDPDVFDAAPRF